MNFPTGVRQNSLGRSVRWLFGRQIFVELYAFTGRGFPLPVRHERGEGEGEGLPNKDGLLSPALSSIVPLEERGQAPSLSTKNFVSQPFPTKGSQHACLTMMLIGVLFAGCAVGPDYQRPKVDTPATFRGDDAATTNSFADLDWWEVYRDDTLQGLIREAFTNNYDLRMALTRVEQARAVAMQARSQFVPNVDYKAMASSAAGAMTCSAPPYPNNAAVGSSAVATLNAFWEVDLWGRVRRLNEAARAQLLASEEARHGVRLSLLGEVAADYFRLLELDEELEIAGRTTNSFGDSLKIFTQRLEGGTASDLETSRAEAALADAASAIPAIQEQISFTENGLCVLLGRNPGTVPRTGLRSNEVLPEVPAGLPSALLERRPDVRAKRNTCCVPPTRRSGNQWRTFSQKLA